MNDFNVAILGCGTVGGGVAKILLEMNQELYNKTGRKIVLKNIVELYPKKASKRFTQRDRDLVYERLAFVILKILEDIYDISQLLLSLP